MNTWQGAWFFAKEEFKRSRWRHLLSVFFTFYVLMFVGNYFADGIKNDESDPFVGWAMDFSAWGLLPILGLMSTQVKGWYWKSDDYTAKLVGWRILPISFRQIALGRIILMLINAIPTLGTFFILLYVMTTQLYGNPVDLAAYLLFALFWFCYSITIALLYTFVEVGFTGKMYFWFCSITVFVLLGLSILNKIVFQDSLFLKIYDLCLNGKGWVSLIALGVAALAVYIGYSAKVIRLQKRDLYR